MSVALSGLYPERQTGILQVHVAINNELHFELKTKSFLKENLYLYPVFNIITRKTLLSYCSSYPEAETALREWYHEMLGATFANFNELKLQWGSASIVGDNRVVFNIMGNKYRLVVRIVFTYKTVQMKWFGTHDEYDKTDVATVTFKKK